VGAVAGSYIGGRYKKTGEIDAVNNQLEKINLQTKLLSETTEPVKNAIADGSWSKRRELEIRREEMEELKRAVYDSQEWASQNFRESLRGQTSVSSSPEPIARMIMLPYFPELKAKMLIFGPAYSGLSIRASNCALSYADYKQHVDVASNATETAQRQKSTRMRQKHISPRTRRSLMRLRQ